MRGKNAIRILGLAALIALPELDRGSTLSRSETEEVKILTTISPEAALEEKILGEYKQLNLDSIGLRKEVFERAYKGYELLKKDGMINDTTKMTIIDYSLPNDEERLFVIDLQNKEAYSSKVLHGINSGRGRYATQFSNRDGSKKSSLGFAVTMKRRGSYKNIVGIVGLEESNSRLFERGIYFHETPGGGHSEGCPAIPKRYASSIIKLIGRDGSLVYLHHDSLLDNPIDKDYSFIETQMLANLKTGWEKKRSEDYAKLAMTQEIRNNLIDVEKTVGRGRTSDYNRYSPIRLSSR